MAKEKSILSTAPTMAPHKPPQEVTIRKADNGGFIVRSYDENYSQKENVYDSMDGVMECLKEKMGGKGKKAKE